MFASLICSLPGTYPVGFGYVAIGSVGRPDRLMFGIPLSSCVVTISSG